MKPLKDTKLGQLLIEKIPIAKEIIGDALPENGVLGIIKNLIQGSELSQEEKAQLLKLHELELNDRSSARNREIEIAKTGKTDWMMTATGSVILISFILCVVAIIFISIPETNRDLFIHLLGIVEGAFVGSMVAYYYSTSKSSAEKQKHIEKLLLK